MKFIRSHLLFLLVLLSLSFFSIFPFLHSGFFSMHDDTQVARVYEMGRALLDGQFPVRWVKDLGYGYGYPIFNFYSPLPYYIGGALAVGGFDALLATKITFVIGILFAAIAMYFLAEYFFGKRIAVIAGLLYIYFPYHAVNIYVRGALGELFAYAFLPLVFLGLLKIHYAKIDQNSFKSIIPSILLSSISIALVVLSHNLSAFMLFLYILIFILISIIFSQEKLKRFVFYCTVLLFAFLFSAFYSVPASLESSFTNVSSQVGGGAAYSDHFVCLPQLWDSPWGFGGSIEGCIDGLSFRLGKLNVILAVISIFFVFLNIRKVQEKKFVFFSSLGLFFISILILLEYSQLAWSSIPYIDFLQYPWRFLNFVGLFMTMLISYFLFMLHKKFSQKIVTTCLVLVVVGIFALNVKLFIPQRYLNVSSASYSNKQYLAFTASKISDEYMPKYFEKPKSFHDIKKENMEVVSGSGSIRTIVDKTTYTSSSVVMNSDGAVRVNKAYFPALKVFIDGSETNYRVKSDGLYVNLFMGKHTIEVKFIQTPIEKASNAFSLLGFLAALIVIIGGKKLYGQCKKTS